MPYPLLCLSFPPTYPNTHTRDYQVSCLLSTLLIDILLYLSTTPFYQHPTILKNVVIHRHHYSIPYTNKLSRQVLHKFYAPQIIWYQESSLLSRQKFDSILAPYWNHIETSEKKLLTRDLLHHPSQLLAKVPGKLFT